MRVGEASRRSAKKLVRCDERDNVELRREWQRDQDPGP